MRAREKQRPPNHDPDRGIERRCARRLNGLAKRLDAGLCAEREAGDGKLCIRQSCCDIPRVDFLAQLDVPAGAPHKTGDHIHAEDMAFADKRAQ